MKILLTNWVQFDDKNLKGGGVSVYLTNIIKGLIEKGHEVSFISCGQHYDLLNRKIRIEETSNIFGDDVKTYRIINSPIKAPAHDEFCSLNEARFNIKLKEVFRNFLLQNGSFDVIHFQNVEGITMDLFDLKKEFPNTKFILTAHNYHIICPQIELFKNRKDICRDFHNGKDCIDCLGHKPIMKSLIRYQRLGSFIEKYQQEGKPLGDLIFSSARNVWQIYKSIKFLMYGFFEFNKRIVKINTKSDDSAINMYSVELEPQTQEKKKNENNMAESYYFWRSDNVILCNKKIDKILVPSDIVREMLIKYGVNKDKVVTLHNGMDYCNTIEGAQKMWNAKKNIKTRVAFFGYPIPSKGFDLFLDALDMLDNEILSEIEILIASRLEGKHKKRIKRLREKVAGIYVVEGYKRSTIPSLMSTVSIGVIPSRWAETYCQVAAELMAFGTPVILSDTVGIKDLIHSDDYIFKSGSAASLSNKLKKLLTQRELLDEFWNKVDMPPTIDEHINKLIDIYHDSFTRS